MDLDIRHVFFLMQENQSYDRMFGWLDRGERVPQGTLVAVNGGAPIPYGPGAVSRQMHKVPHASFEVMRRGYFDDGATPDHQPLDHPRQPELQRAWVEQHASELRHAFRIQGQPLSDSKLRMLQDAIVRQSVLHLTSEQVPVYEAFAKHFAVCDHWFATQLAFTLPNRWAFIHDKVVDLSHSDPDAPRPADGAWSLMRALKGMGISFDAYAAPPAPLLSGPLALTGHLKRPEPIANLHDDIRRWNKNKRHFVWIDGRHQGDNLSQRSNDHRHAHLLNGQALAAQVYNAICAHPDIWEHSLFVVSYDEHGGYWDHVAPPRRHQSKGWSDWFGGRIPAMLVSPWVKPGGLVSGTHDNTALLAFLRDHWQMPVRTDGPSSWYPPGAAFAGAWSDTLRTDTPAIDDPWTRAGEHEEQVRDIADVAWRAYLTDLTGPTDDDDDLAKTIEACLGNPNLAVDG